MDDMMHAALAGWADFYLITGTAAGALAYSVLVLWRARQQHSYIKVAGPDGEWYLSR